MTDTTIRVRTATRQRLKMYAATEDETQDEALQRALDAAGAPTIDNFSSP